MSTWSELSKDAALRSKVASSKRQRGRGLPDESREFASIPVVADATAVGGEVVLVPPGQLRCGRQGIPVGLLAADQVAAHRHQPSTAPRPERGEDVGGAGSPVEPADDRIRDLQRVQQRDRIQRERALLAVAHRIGRPERGGPVSAQERDHHPVAGVGEHGNDVVETVDVVRPAVQEQHGPPIRRPDVDVAHVERPGVDLLHRERGIRHRSDLNASRNSELNTSGSCHAAK